MKIIAVSNLLGSRSPSGLIKILYRIVGANLLVLLGNVISPSIIEDLVKEGVAVKGVPGSLDDSSMIQALKRTGCLVESRELISSRCRAFFVGTNFKPCLERAASIKGNVDFLFTFYPPCGCRKRVGVCSPWVDDIIDLLKPNLVINGYCGKQCLNGKCLSPGPGYLGDLVVLNTLENTISFVNVNDVVYGMMGEKVSRGIRRAS